MGSLPCIVLQYMLYITYLILHLKNIALATVANI